MSDTIAREIYLENVTTRHAFYHIKIVSITSATYPYRIDVSWGKIGTEGQTVTKSRAKGLDKAILKMTKLADAKRQRHYIDTPKGNKWKLHKTTYVPPYKGLGRFGDLELD